MKQIVTVNSASEVELQSDVIPRTAGHLSSFGVTRVTCAVMCRVLLSVLMGCWSSGAHPARAQVALEGVQSASKFVVAPGATDKLQFRFRNRAQEPVKATLRWQITDREGKNLASRDEAVTLAPDATTTANYQFDTRGLEIGEYGARATLETSNNGQKTRLLAFRAAACRRRAG
jgi:hypothetical protein